MVARHFYAFRALCINSSARTSLLPHRSCAAPIPSEAGQQRQPLVIARLVTGLCGAASRDADG